MHFDLLVKNIDTLISIKENEKLWVTNNEISINKYSLLRPICRYFNNQNRNKTNFVIICTIREFKDEIYKYYNFHTNNSSLKLHEINIKSKDEYNIYLNKLYALKLSIEHLKKTYSSEKSFVRNLEATKQLITSNSL